MNRTLTGPTLTKSFGKKSAQTMASQERKTKGSRARLSALRGIFQMFADLPDPELKISAPSSGMLQAINRALKDIPDFRENLLWELEDCEAEKIDDSGAEGFLACLLASWLCANQPVARAIGMGKETRPRANGTLSWNRRL